MRLLSRNDWGADPTLPRKGYVIGASRRTEVIIHHTATLHGRDAPNEWPTLDAVKARMRWLQTARPDLGLDVPYNMVAFCMRDGGLVVCEGRGLYRTGAHTRDRNRSALGIAFYGEFESGPAPRYFDLQIGMLASWLRTLRNEQGFTKLGYSRPEGRQVWGHREIRSARTLCPGQALQLRLPQIRFIDEEDDTAMDRATWKLVQKALQSQDPPLYAGKRIDGLPGRNTNTAVQAFERRVGLEPRGVIGERDNPNASIWPATRELLFSTAGRALGR